MDDTIFLWSNISKIENVPSYVQMRHLNTTLFAGTPFQNFTFDQDKKKCYTRQNLADAYRLAILYHVGGRYIDGDIISLNTWPRTREAEVTKQEDQIINNCVLQFPKRHPCIFALMQNFVAKYDNCKWGNQGPQLLSRMMTDNRCSEIFVHDKDTFSPIHYKVRHPDLSKQNINRLKTLGTIAIHMYNKVWKGKIIPDMCLSEQLHQLHL